MDATDKAIEDLEVITDLTREQLHITANQAGQVAGAEEVDLDITFDPPWNQNKMSEEAKAQLGL